MNRRIPAVPLLSYCEVLLFIVVIGGWQFFTGTPLTNRTAITISGFYVVLTFLGNLRTTSNSPSSVAREEKREFVSDPRQVLEIAKLTGYESVRRFTPYLGKWITISGTYEGVAKAPGQDSTHLSILLKDSRRVNLRFAAERESEIRGLQPGQQITANCQIQHFNFTFAPENCELVRVEPLGNRGSLRAIAS